VKPDNRPGKAYERVRNEGNSRKKQARSIREIGETGELARKSIRKSKK